MLKIDKEKLIMAFSSTALTIREAAENAELSTTIISKILNGHTVNVRPSTVGKLAKALNVKVEDLLEEN